MSPLINLPPAYWANVPWWAFLIVFAVVAVLSTPFAIQLARGRASAYVSREQVLAQRAANLEQLREASLVDARRNETMAREELRAERVENAARVRRLETKVESSVDKARFIEDLAHKLRHELIEVIMRFNALLSLFKRHGAGLIARERAAAIAEEITPIQAPPPIPKNINPEQIE